MSAALVLPSQRPSEPINFETLLGNVLRQTGWIMMGGSAQFRDGALAELRDNLQRLPELGVPVEVLHLARFLAEKAAAVSTRQMHEVSTIMALQRTLAEFEQAIKTCAARR